MYVYLIAAILSLFTPAALADCCCCDGSTPPTTDSSQNEAALWRLYDGDGTQAFGAPDPSKPTAGPTQASTLQAGATCKYFNAAAHLSWKNLGGDWVDLNNTPQGNTPYASQSIGKVTNHTFTMNVTALLNAPGIIIRLSKAQAVTLGSRENSTAAYRPKLIVTKSDSSIVELDPSADVAMSASSGTCSTFKGVGKSQVLTLGTAAALQWTDIPTNAVSAQLRLTAISSTGSTAVQAYALSIPYSTIQPVTTGFSSSYANDVGLENDSRVVYFESWDKDVDKWYERAGMSPPKGTSLADGLFARPAWSGVHIANNTGTFPIPGSTATLPRNGGKYRDGLSYIMRPDVLASGAEVPTVNIRQLGYPDEAEEMYMRYYWKADNNFKDFAYCEGGKMVGLVGSNITGANSGVPANGLNGWTLRLSFALICDPGNPAYGRVNTYVYAYHGDMTDLNGEGWHMGELGLWKRNQWYCVEQHVRVNTPGVRDGLMRAWVNGRLVSTRQNIFLRDTKPPRYGYGRWDRVTANKPCRRFGSLDPATGKLRLCPECATFTGIDGRNFCLSGEQNPTPQLGINRLWGMVHNGGKNEPGIPAKATMDQVVVATERIGCGSFTQ